MTYLAKIAHLSSVHARNDTRIFTKMCISTVSSGFSVYLVVADGKGNETKSNIDIIDVGVSNGRLDRIFNATRRVFKKALELDADVYHLHDPELIPVGLKLKKQGKVVIFDSHEDVGKQILCKPYLNRYVGKIFSLFYGVFERYACSKIDAVVAATPFIRDKFSRTNKRTININNYPIISELSNSVRWSEKEKEVLYVGAIARIRGIEEIVSALEYTEGIRLNLAGSFCGNDFEKNIRKKTSWGKVNELGFLSRDKVHDVLARSIAGLVTLHPTINYLDSLPVKMFEYMAAGIPVVASNFPLWEKIINESKCGVCVDPLNPKEIADKIQYLVDHPVEAEEMGRNGRKAVADKYSWAMEEKKLISLYNGLIPLRDSGAN